MSLTIKAKKKRRLMPAFVLGKYSFIGLIFTFPLLLLINSLLSVMIMKYMVGLNEDE